MNYLQGVTIIQVIKGFIKTKKVFLRTVDGRLYVKSIL